MFKYRIETLNGFKYGCARLAPAVDGFDGTYYTFLGINEAKEYIYSPLRIEVQREGLRHRPNLRQPFYELCCKCLEKRKTKQREDKRGIYRDKMI